MSACIRLAFNQVVSLGFTVFLPVLIQHLRPDVVDIANKVEVIAAHDILESYDFVIIGAGSAGSVLANRLTENTKWTVLLLEAGGPEEGYSDIPAMVSFLQHTDLDWKFKTENSSTYCLGMDNQKCNWARGKGLGGSSTINNMIYVRGNKKDYDHWRDLGNPGWGYEDVLPYFKKSENMSIPSLRGSKYHGTEGYLNVEEARYHYAITENFLAAGSELGYDLLDVNGDTQTGFMYTQNTLRDGLRCSTAKAFLRPASHRKNLHVSTDSMVHQIRVNETTKTAYGVQFLRGNKEHVVYINKEVILSAGSIQSPQLLMLSGIGPKEHLEEVGVQVIHDSPGVGQNLQDHVAVGGLNYLHDPMPDSARAASVDRQTVEEFLNHKNGSLHAFLGGEALGFVNSGTANVSLDYPDIQLIFATPGENAGAGFISEKYYGFKPALMDKLYGDIFLNPSYLLAPLLLRPKSRGHIKLRNADPDQPPIIVPNYFDDPDDINVLVQGIKIVHNISHTKAMKKVNARINSNSIPQCVHLDQSSDDYLKCHIRHYTLTLYHPSGTCKMGPANDSMAVVDSRLKVHGVGALRVIDASVMPYIVSGNINAPTIMIAEKAADFIKEMYAFAA